MKRRTFASLFRICWCAAALLCALAAPARANLDVVATTPDLSSLAAIVGAGHASVHALALPTQDPHWVDARPNLVLELSHADLLIAVGAELELGWLPTLQIGARNPKVQAGSRGFLDCSTLVNLLERPAGKVDRSQGDIHPGGSPHYVLDPRIAERLAVEIAKRMAELDPVARDAYLANVTAFVAQLRAARAGWEQKLTALRGREVIAFHRSLAYLADWLGLVVVDHVEPKPGIPPNPRHVAEVIERARARHVWAVLQEAWYPANTSKLIAQQIGGRFIELPGATNFQGGETYIGFMERLVALLGGAA
jgi:zinc/manganese transport system substrate-binding protein